MEQNSGRLIGRLVRRRHAKIDVGEVRDIDVIDFFVGSVLVCVNGFDSGAE